MQKQYRFAVWVSAHVVVDGVDIRDRKHATGERLDGGVERHGGNVATDVKSR